VLFRLREQIFGKRVLTTRVRDVVAAVPVVSARAAEPECLSALLVRGAMLVLERAQRAATGESERQTARKHQAFRSA
jgi:hypothetical protein